MQGNSALQLTNMWSMPISPFSRRKNIEEIRDPWQNVAKQGNEYINLKTQIQSVLSGNNLL